MLKYFPAPIVETPHFCRPSSHLPPKARQAPDRSKTVVWQSA
jgi:hypothetical protein